VEMLLNSSISSSALGLTEGSRWSSWVWIWGLK